MRYKKIFQVLLSVFVLALSVSSVLPAQRALAAPAIILSPSSGIVGSTLTVNGTGFTANTTGTVVFGSGSSFATSFSATSDNTGAFARSFSVPSAPGASYTILATLGTSASASFIVTPTLNVSATSTRVGESVSINGTGFSASVTATLTYDGSTFRSITTANNGSFSTTLTVPHSVYGSHTVVASTGTLSSSRTLSVLPFITISPVSGGVGSTLTVTGTGFRGSAAITVTLDGTQRATATSSSIGDFSASFAVPAITGGSHSISASDSLVSASATFTLLSTLQLSATSGNVGASITVGGSAFRNSVAITISLGGTQITQTTSDTGGSFSISLTIPASPGGARTLAASDGTFSASAAFTVLSSINVNPASGKVGGKATVSGTGFGSSKSVGVSFDNASATTVNSDASGSFSVKIDIPPSSAGGHTISANDGALAANGAFTTLADISASTARAPMGTQVTVSGTGFAAAGAIVIQVDNSTVKNATADSKGSFSEKFPVPQLDAGDYSLTASDGTNSVSMPFTLTASFNISLTTGNVGGNITVSGTGFSGTVSVRYDDTVVTTTTAGTNGVFSTVFTVPASVYGSHIISVNDAATRLQLTFSVESTPPPVPSLLQPLTGVRQNRQPELIWGTVSDPSGVTYSLQIATDASFTDMVMEKKDLAETQYQLVSAEKLHTVKKNTPYYWRVKAVDLAQNESDWSAPRSFYVTLLPPWVLVALIALGAVIAVLLLVRLVLIRRGSYF